MTILTLMMLKLFRENVMENTQVTIKIITKQIKHSKKKLNKLFLVYSIRSKDYLGYNSIIKKLVLC